MTFGANETDRNVWPETKLSTSKNVSVDQIIVNAKRQSSKKICLKCCKKENKLVRIKTFDGQYL